VRGAYSFNMTSVAENRIYVQSPKEADGNTQERVLVFIKKLKLFFQAGDFP
jgi:hypothetical protein